MKTVSFISAFLILTSCKNRQENSSFSNNKNDTYIKHDTIYLNSESKRDWQKGFGLTHDPDLDSIWNKPVSYYIQDKELSPLVTEFYYGYIEPGDNGTTDELLKYVTTDNKKLRPFYRWCLNKTIQVSDGALAEHVRVPARKYAEKFPKEFFEYMDIDTTGGKYLDWTGAIEYSGFYDEDNYKKPNTIRKNLVKEMKENCKNCDEKTIKKIEKFALDCFQDFIKPETAISN